ncbi:MAG: hypothetical protein WCL16_12390 [bacterium]
MKQNRLVSQLRRLIGGGSKPEVASQALVFLVEPDTVARAGGRGGSVVRKIQAFCVREKLPACVVFCGGAKPHAGDAAIKGVIEVQHVATREEFPGALHALIARLGRSRQVLVLTDRDEWDLLATKSGAEVMKLATFWKAIETISGPIHGEAPKPRVAHAARPAAPAPANPANVPDMFAPDSGPPPAAAPVSRAAVRHEPHGGGRRDPILDLIDPL